MNRPTPPINNPIYFDAYLYSCGYMPKEIFETYLPEPMPESEAQQASSVERQPSPEPETDRSFWGSLLVIVAIATTLSGTVALGLTTYRLLNAQQPTIHDLGTPAAWKF